MAAVTATDDTAPHERDADEVAITDDRAVLPGWAVLVAALVGLALRVWTLRSPLGVLDSDEAVGGLMALNLLDGHIPVFLWGNVHGGVVEAYPSAALLALFEPSALLLKSVMVVAYALGCYLTYWLGRLLAGEAVGRFAGCLLWLYPGALVLISTKARMYYGGALVLTLAILILCVLLDRDFEWRKVALLGLFVGLGLYTAPFVFYGAAPAGLWLAVRNWRSWRLFPLLVPGAIVGSLPWLYYNLTHDLASLREPPVPVESTYLERLRLFITDMLPKGLGFQWSTTDIWPLHPLSPILYAVALLALGVVAYRHRSRLSLLIAVAVGYGLVLAVPASSSYVREPRYALFLIPVVAVVAAVGVVSLVRAPLAQVGILAVAVLLSIAGLQAMIDFQEENPGQHDVAPPPLDPLIEELEERQVTHVFADYWIAYRLSFRTDREILATPTDFVRYAPHHEEVLAERAATYVVHLGAPKDDALRAELDRTGIGYDREEVGAFAVFELEEFTPPDRLPAAQFVP